MLSELEKYTMAGSIAWPSALKHFLVVNTESQGQRQARGMPVFLALERYLRVDHAFITNISFIVKFQATLSYIILHLKYKK